MYGKNQQFVTPAGTSNLLDKEEFYASNMNLQIDSDAVYLVAPKAKSCIAEFFYYTKKTSTTKSVPFLNGPVHIKCRALCHVLTFAAEAEMVALFYNMQMALSQKSKLIIIKLKSIQY